MNFLPEVKNGEIDVKIKKPHTRRTYTKIRHTNPRAKGTNTRNKGTNPRALKINYRLKVEALLNEKAPR